MINVTNQPPNRPATPPESPNSRNPRHAMADDDDAGALSDVDEDPLPPPPPPSSSSSSKPQPPSHPHAEAQQQQRILDLTSDLEEERRLRRAAEESLASSETRLGRLKAFAQDALRKRDESAAAAAASARALQALQSEAATASSMLASGLERISAKACPSAPPAPLPTSHKYSAGLPALAYGVLKRANDIADDLLAQIAAARRDRDDRNYQIAIEVSELEAAVASRAAEAESLSKSLSDRDAQLAALRDQLTPLLADQIGCASRLYDEVRQLVALVDPDAAGALPDSVFVWKEADVEESLRVSLEGTRMAFDIAAMALQKVAAWRDRGDSKLSELQGKVEDLVREKEHIGVLLRSALQANTSEVLKVAEDGLREAGIEIGLNGHRDHRPGSADKDEVYTLAGALENSMKESQIKIIELQHLVEAQRAESGLLRTRMEGQEKEIAQLRKQIKHLEEKERLANDSVEGLMMDVTAAEEEIKRWKMAAEEEADAGRSIEQEFQIQLTSLHKELEEAKESMLELENKLKFKEETAAAAMAARDAAEKSLKLADTRSARLRERLEELNRQAEESEGRVDPSSGSGRHRYMCWPWQWLGLNYVRLPPAETEEASNEMELSEPLI